MKLIVLCDNNTFIDNYLLGEPALSYYIQNGKDKILFDLGYSNVYKINAKRLNIDITNVNKIAFSHGHDDHTRGLKYLPKECKPLVYYTPQLFEEKWCDGLKISAPYTLEQMKCKYKLKEVKNPVEISKNLYYLGPIPRVFKWEKNTSKTQHIVNGKLQYDEMPDDTALCYVADDGIVIIQGCSHSGICNTCEYAKRLFNKPIKCIIGGFHIMSLDDKAKHTIKYFQKQQNIQLYPCHCTCLEVKAALINTNLNVQDVGSGLILEF